MSPLSRFESAPIPKTLGAAITVVGLWAFAVPAAGEALCVTDDRDREVCLDAPAERLISLSPHTTEQLFAVGAGERIIGTVNHSDYPEAAAAIPRVGGYHQIDLERVVEKAPDLVVAWHSGNPHGAIERMEGLGLVVYVSEPRRLDDVARGLERLGRLTGHAEEAGVAAAAFRDDTAALRAEYADRDPVTLFYQIWERPLMTVNDEHLVGEAIALCGGRNIFGDSNNLVPRIDVEGVLAADPEVILAGGMGEERADWLDDWLVFDSLTAVARDNLVFIPPSLIQRHTPRILKGTRQLCEALEVARERRPGGAE